MLTLLVIFSQSILSIASNLSISRNADHCGQIVKREVSSALQRVSIEAARKQFEAIIGSFNSLHFNLNVKSFYRMILNKNFSSIIELMVQHFDEELISRLKLFPNKEPLKALKMERTITQMLLNSVLPRKAEPVITSITSMNGLSLSPERQSLSKLLEDVYDRERQTHGIYQRKLSLRQKIYSLLSREMEEKIDLFLIGSSLTHLGSNCSDTDLCLIIYDSNDNIDDKYETREAVLYKLEELGKILESNGFSSNPKVIPALVPILKFIETSTGIEININVNRIVTIRNTHLLYTYSRMDRRVAQLILIVKLWAKKNGINSAYNKSLTSYSISLMVIHFLQSVCSPPVVPCLQKTYPQLFVEDVAQLRLTSESIQFRSTNNQSLGQLFTQFFEYFSMYFNYDKVISIRSATLLDKELLISRLELNGGIRQWKCHICIEEPFIGTNTSHAVHDCRMFREILQKFMDTYHQIINGSFTLSSNGLTIN